MQMAQLRRRITAPTSRRNLHQQHCSSLDDVALPADAEGRPDAVILHFRGLTDYTNNTGRFEGHPLRAVAAFKAAISNLFFPRTDADGGCSGCGLELCLNHALGITLWNQKFHRSCLSSCKFRENKILWTILSIYFIHRVYKKGTAQ